MSGETKSPSNYNAKISLPEVLFSALLAIAAVSSIWLSSTLLMYLYRNL